MGFACAIAKPGDIIPAMPVMPPRAAALFPAPVNPAPVSPVPVIPVNPVLLLPVPGLWKVNLLPPECEAAVFEKASEI